MQYSVHTPNSFICAYWNRLLPGWSCPVLSVLVVLQHCRCSLLGRTAETEIQKHELRQHFIQFGHAIAHQLQHLGYLADLFDPKTGFPVLSPPGTVWLDDVAVVRTCLGYPTTEQHGCSIIVHPTWGTAVYPSILLSSAEPELVAQVVKRLAGGWVGSGSVSLTRSEYHHSLRGDGKLTQ